MPAELYRVTKMKIPKVKGQPDRSTIIYNTRVTLSDIPEEAYRPKASHTPWARVGAIARNEGDVGVRRLSP